MGPGDFFLGSGAAGIIKLTTHLHLVFKLRIMEAVPPPLLMTSWHILGQFSLMKIKEFIFPVWLPQYNLPSIKPHTICGGGGGGGHDDDDESTRKAHNKKSRIGRVL